MNLFKKKPKKTDALKGVPPFKDKLSSCVGIYACLAGATQNSEKA